VREAFAAAAHSGGTECAIVAGLRDAGALTISLVADEGGEVIGHVAVSPVAAQAQGEWFGLGPVAVGPQRQREGIGTALIRQALHRLRRLGAAGCVVLGDPAYYARFGFEHDPAVTYADIPPPHFQVLAFGGERLAGAVTYHPAFEQAE
jgi:putative acetyltransferase